MQLTRARIAGLAIAALGVGLVGVRVSAAPSTVELTLDPKGASKAYPGYMPLQIPLTEEKPAGITKEPAYAGKAKYASIKVGNGPKNATWVALDEPEGGEWKVYVDLNQNGDLTDDGASTWVKKTEGNGRVVHGVNSYDLNGSWDVAGKAVTAKYGMALYRISSLPYLLGYREAARTGTLSLDGKNHKVALLENDSDGIYTKVATSIEDARKTRPLWLLLDLNDDGKFAPAAGELFDVRAPFKIGEKTYEVTVPADGSSLKLAETTKVAIELTPKPAPRPPLLASGVEAPNFTAEAWGGGDLKLSDYKGKVVILDFWATWCGPCQRSMPHLQKVYQGLKDQPVQVLAVAVWDDKDAYTKWVPTNQDKYTFKFAFDPAGKDNAKSIASSMYKVSGIPTTYIIDKEGKVAEAIVGFSGENDNRIEKALEKLGIAVK